jgi:hypothetical protein
MSLQNGSIMRSVRRRGPDVWEYRWREPGPDGRRKHRRMVVGSVLQLGTKMQPYAQLALCAGISTWRTFPGTGSPSLSRN